MVKDRLDARKVARILDWRLEEVAAYLRRDSSTVSRNPNSHQYQDQLAKLVSTVGHAFALVGKDLGLVRAWLRMPVPVMERTSPKDLILAGRIAEVDGLLDEVEDGFAA